MHNVSWFINKTSNCLTMKLNDFFIFGDILGILNSRNVTNKKNWYIFLCHTYYYYYYTFKHCILFWTYKMLESCTFFVCLTSSLKKNNRALYMDNCKKYFASYMKFMDSWSNKLLYVCVVYTYGKVSNRIINKIGIKIKFKNLIKFK